MVRCQDCGFLAVRHWETRQLVEVEGNMRATGQCPTLITARRNLYETTAICFVRAQELHKDQQHPDNTESFLKVIQLPRNCPQYTDWQQGSTPREHKEMLAEKEEREWRADQERKDREYRDRQRKEDEEREGRRRKEDIEYRDRQTKAEVEYRDRRDRDDAEWKLREERESRHQSNRQLWIAGVAIALVTAAIVCGTQLYCTWWQISDAHTFKPAATTPATAPPLTRPAND